MPDHHANLARRCPLAQIDGHPGPQVGHRDAVCLTYAHGARGGIDVEDRVVRVDPAHTAHAGERVGAGGNELGGAVLGEQVHHHEDVLGADRQIHRPADGGDRVGGAGVPVGQIAVCADLESAHHAHVEVTAAHHRERVGVVE